MTGVRGVRQLEPELLPRLFGVGGQRAHGSRGASPGSSSRGLSTPPRTAQTPDRFGTAHRSHEKAPRLRPGQSGCLQWPNSWALQLALRDDRGPAGPDSEPLPVIVELLGHPRASRSAGLVLALVSTSGSSTSRLLHQSDISPFLPGGVSVPQGWPAEPLQDVPLHPALVGSPVRYGWLPPGLADGDRDP